MRQQLAVAKRAIRVCIFDYRASWCRMVTATGTNALVARGDELTRHSVNAAA